MRFRTKVFLIFLLLAVFSSSLVALVVYVRGDQLVFNLLRANVLSIAATAGAMIDPEKFEAIKSRDDQGSPAYLAIEQQLRRARDANRRPDPYDLKVKYLYSMRPYDKEGKIAEFVVDAEENTPDKSNVGDVYKTENTDYRVHFNEYQADRTFVRDQWGVWLTANAPIRNAQGDVIGAVGADVNAKDALTFVHQLLWMELGALAVSLAAAYFIAAYASHKLTRPLTVIRGALERISAGDYGTTLRIHSKDEFGEIAEVLNTMTLGLQQRDALKSALSRYVSEDILTDVIFAGKASGLFGQRKRVTVLFADVQGFTNLSEQISPEETVTLLNAYFEKMIEATFKNGGHLNKFMGDGLMALFGALRDDDYQEEHAIQAALDMRKALLDLQAEWSEDSKANEALRSLRIGIGINTGMAIVGNIGSQKRMDFTAIGDCVNLGARLEQATRTQGVDILVSEYTYVAVRSRFAFKPSGDIAVKGKSGTVRTYSISL